MKTIEERIEEAERKVERCESDVDDAESDLADARSALEDAEEELEALEEEAQAPKREAEAKLAAAFIADRSGPMRRAGDRPIRTVCSLSEIPPEFGRAMMDGVLKGLSSNGAHWASNGHWAIRVESNDGLTVLDYDPFTMFGAPGDPVVRDDAPGKSGSLDVRTFGTCAADLRYTSLVEDLFPGIEWRRGRDALTPFHAVVNGETVAVVMPVRWDAEVPS